MNQPLFVLGGIILLLIAGLAAYNWRLQEEIDDREVEIQVVQRERDTARAQTKQLYRSIDSLAVEREAANMRAKRLQAGREAVIATPASEDGPIANTLLKGLQAADQIGGHQ